MLQRHTSRTLAPRTCLILWGLFYRFLFVFFPNSASSSECQSVEGISIHRSLPPPQLHDGGISRSGANVDEGRPASVHNWPRQANLQQSPRRQRYQAPGPWHVPMLCKEPVWIGAGCRWGHTKWWAQKWIAWICFNVKWNAWPLRSWLHFWCLI